MNAGQQHDGDRLPDVVLLAQGHRFARAGLCAAEDKPREPSVERRTLHRALLRFVAAARQPSGNMAYRVDPVDPVDPVDDSERVAPSSESHVGREIRRSLLLRLAPIGLCVTLIWGVLAAAYLHSLFAEQLLDEELLYVAVATTPPLLAMAASSLRSAARRSLAERTRPLAIAAKLLLGGSCVVMAIWLAGLFF